MITKVPIAAQNPPKTSATRIAKIAKIFNPHIDYSFFLVKIVNSFGFFPVMFSTILLAIGNPMIPPMTNPIIPKNFDPNNTHPSPTANARTYAVPFFIIFGQEAKSS